jgi:hypothetical protein
MTKETYFEMCEALGSKPIESEVPVEYEDLPNDVQEAMGIYSKLRDEWDTMNGNYMGKNYSSLSVILDILEVPTDSRRNILDLLAIIDTHRAKIIQDSKPKNTAQSNKPQ